MFEVSAMYSGQRKVGIALKNFALRVGERLGSEKVLLRGAEMHAVLQSCDGTTAVVRVQKYQGKVKTTLGGI